MSDQHFVFLQMADEEINRLVAEMKRLATGSEHWRAASLTVRGPCPQKPTLQEMSEFEQKLGGAPLCIEGAGSFSNFDEEIVFLNVRGGNLQKIWHKPDYPTKENGMKPHITIYRGQDHEWAKTLKWFLFGENLRIFCKNYFLSIYSISTAKPGRLLAGYRKPSDSFEEIEGNLLAKNQNRIKQGILARLEALSKNRRHAPSAPDEARWQTPIRA